MATRRTSEEAHAQLLDAADALFYSQGLSATGINQIISTAGVAKATFYAHFASKLELAIAYLGHRHEAWFSMLHAHVAKSRSARARALAPFKFLEVWLVDVDFRGCAFLNIQGEHPLPPRLAKQVLTHKEELREFFVDSLTELVPDAKERRFMADHLLLLFEGALVEAQVHHDVWPIRTAARAAERLVPKKEK